MLASAQRARHRASRSWGSYGRTGVGPPNASPSPIGAWRLSRSYDLPHPRSCALSFVGWKRKRPPHEAQEAKGGHGVRARYMRRSVPEAATSLIVPTLHPVSGQAQRRSGDELGASAPEGPGECGGVVRLNTCFRARSAVVAAFMFRTDMAEQPGGASTESSPEILGDVRLPDDLGDEDCVP